MVNYTVVIECSDLIKNKFEIGSVIGRLIRNNGWHVIRTYKDTATRSDFTLLGFGKESAAAKACALIDEEGIAGLTVHTEKA